MADRALPGRFFRPIGEKSPKVILLNLARPDMTIKPAIDSRVGDTKLFGNGLLTKTVFESIESKLFHEIALGGHKCSL